MDNIPADIENEMKIKPFPEMPEFIGRIPADIVKSNEFNAAEKALLCGVDEIKQMCKFNYEKQREVAIQSRSAEFELRLKVKRIWQGIGAVFLMLIGSIAKAAFSYLTAKPHL